MAVAEVKNVSRETLEQLKDFEELVRKWTRKINLISAGDVSQIWNRHIMDSIQVYNIANRDGSWLDIGSGGGFPGIVAAILAKEETPTRSFVLVDSDQRKCAFLRTAARELNLNVSVCAERVEEMAPKAAAVLTARALDNLSGLLKHAERHLDSNGTAIFPKGAKWRIEHEEAQKHWSYDLDVIISKTNPDATILKIKEIKRV